MSQRFDIVEGAMKRRQWTCRRQPVEQMEALHRWDRAYQCLLRWGAPQEEECARQEGSDEDRSLYSSVGASASADLNHRAAIGAAAAALSVPGVAVAGGADFSG